MRTTATSTRTCGVVHDKIRPTKTTCTPDHHACLGDRGAARHGLEGAVMPVRKSGGGYKYGTKGKTYKGKGAKAKAARQGRAIKASQAQRKK